MNAPKPPKININFSLPARSGGFAYAPPKPSSPDQDMRQLVALFNARRLPEAASLAQQVVGKHPQLVLAWRILGMAVLAMGRDAVVPWQQVTRLTPKDAEAWNNLGSALEAAGDKAGAMAAFEHALLLSPELVEAHNNLGTLHLDAQRFDQALACFDRALALNNDVAQLHNNRGNALRGLGRFDDACESFQRALALSPNYPKAHSNLGTVLQDLARYEEAEQAFQAALALSPDMAEAHNNLGNLYRTTGRLEQAVESLGRALDLSPKYAEAHNNMGHVLLDQGRPADALEGFKYAVEIKPEFELAYVNMGTALRSLNRFDESADAFHKALDIKPDFDAAHCNLGITLQDQGRLPEALESYRKALEINPNLAAARGNVLFIHNYMLDRSTDDLLIEARAFGDMATQWARPFTNWNVQTDPSRRLRIGLVSGDLCVHPVGFFLETVLRALANDSSDVLELYAYSTNPRTDALTDRVRPYFSRWTSTVGLSDERLAERIHADQVDILMDLSGHTGHNRLPMFAWRPAPIQVSWLGYFATTGLPAMDYFLTDPFSSPAECERHFTEKLWRLPDTRLCFSPPEHDVPVAPLPVLEKQQITFGCYNNLTKMNDAVIAVWARVLNAVPGSRLKLKAKQLDELSVRTSVQARFAAQGIAAERLWLEGQSSRQEYLVAYRDIDIALDPFPFTGGTTTAESLWMGVPVLTLAGDRLVSRQGVALMANAGLSGWIAKDVEDYVAKAATFAKDVGGLARLREGLRQQVLDSPVFDAPRFGRHFTEALRGMWAQWCAQASR